MGKINQTTDELQNILDGASATTENTIAINSEIQARELADEVLYFSLTGETTSRELADTILNDNITGETATRISADNALSNRIDLALTGETQGLQSVLTNGGTYNGSQNININTSGTLNLTGGTSGISILAAQMGAGIIIDANAMTGGLNLKCGANSAGVVVKADNKGLSVINSGGISRVAFDVDKVNFPVLSAPATSTSSGEAGEVRITSSYIYVCIAANTWRRATLSTF